MYLHLENLYILEQGNIINSEKFRIKLILSDMRNTVLPSIHFMKRLVFFTLPGQKSIWLQKKGINLTVHNTMASGAHSQQGHKAKFLHCCFIALRDIQSIMQSLH